MEHKTGYWCRLVVCLLAAVVPAATPAVAETFTINTPGGPVQVDIGHVGPGGSLVSPDSPTAPGFRPPTIFSAPLPSGSGARALGFAGAFTAVADDATAASWNPAGLIQLEKPEWSAVARGSWEVNNHRSGDASYQVGRDSFGSANLNYFSAAYPFRVNGRNWVISANHQEAYDFTQLFTADMSDVSTGTKQETTSATYYQTITEKYIQGGTSNTVIDIDVTSRLTTRVTSYLQQLLDADMLTSLEFEQKGVVDAITPAIAVEITPKFSVGASVNIYEDSSAGAHQISSRTVAGYSGVSGSRFQINDRRITTGNYTYSGYLHIPVGGGSPVPIDLFITGAGDYGEFSDTSSSARQGDVVFDGVYEELNRYRDFYGYNVTIGALWTVSRRLSLGFGMDLPWDATAEQSKTVRNTITTYNAARTQVLDVSETEETETKSTTFEFPLYWSVGAVWRWNNRLYTTIDLSETLWSDFSFQAEGDEKLNPLDGSTHGLHPVDDCWSVRCGVEYLCVLMKTEVPLRAGVSWEQHPAVGSPDEYLGLSLGSGISIGKDPGKLILDVAYMYSRGEDVLGTLVSDQQDLETDVSKHQLYISGIWHF